MEQQATVVQKQPRIQRGHTKARAPLIKLDQPGRLRVAHLMALYGVSHSTIYQRISDGAYPKPDGYDGRCPFWKTETIRNHIDP